MRTDSVLWVFWLAWALWLLGEIYPEISVIKWSSLLLTAGGLIVVSLTLLPKGNFFMRLLKRENKAVSESARDNTSCEDVSEHSVSSEGSALLSPQGAETIKPIRTRKDTFISAEAHLSGDLEGEGNIVIEGRLKGNIRSSHQIRIEAGGITEGDIYAQHIVVNGYVLGDLHAEAVTLQSEGRIEGAIFAGELVIEKGGSFTGHSEMNKKSEKLPIIAAIKSVATTGSKASSEAPATSPVAELTQPERFESQDSPGHLSEKKVSKDSLVIPDGPAREATLTGRHRNKV